MTTDEEHAFRWKADPGARRTIEIVDYNAAWPAQSEFIERVLES